MKWWMDYIPRYEIKNILLIKGRKYEKNILVRFIIGFF